MRFLVDRCAGRRLARWLSEDGHDVVDMSEAAVDPGDPRLLERAVEEERGPVVEVPAGKTRITIRVDEDVVQWFREQVHAAGGGNYQTLMNAALREHIEGRREPLEETLRRVIREELRTV
jgi:uncharacterized protein (DUF4415 family)